MCSFVKGHKHESFNSEDGRRAQRIVKKSGKTGSAGRNQKAVAAGGQQTQYTKLSVIEEEREQGRGEELREQGGKKKEWYRD